jgi:hypothetical protein
MIAIKIMTPRHAPTIINIFLVVGDIASGSKKQKS